MPLVRQYTNWQLQTGPKGESVAHTVRRRYTDFAWLRTFLSKKFPGMFIPSLPVKPATKPANDKMLGKFLEALGEAEFLKVSPRSLAHAADFLGLRCCCARKVAGIKF